MRAELRQRLHAALVVELTRLRRNRPPHNLTRHSQPSRNPSDALALDKVRAADPSYRLHGHHPGWPPLQPEEASADARVGQLLSADPKPSRSTIPRRSTPFLDEVSSAIACIQFRIGTRLSRSGSKPGCDAKEPMALAQPPHLLAEEGRTYAIGQPTRQSSIDRRSVAACAKSIESNRRGAPPALA